MYCKKNEANHFREFISTRTNLLNASFFLLKLTIADSTKYLYNHLTLD